MARGDRDDRRRGHSNDDEEEADGDYERSSKRRKKKSSRKEDRRRSRSPQRDDADEDDKGRDRKHRNRDRRKDEEKPRDRKRDRKEASRASDSSSGGDDGTGSDNGDISPRRRRDRHDKKKRKDDSKKKKKSKEKKDKKKKKRKHKREDDSSSKHKKSGSSKEEDSDSDNDEQAASAMKEFERNYALAEALYELLIYHPTNMATDTLPLLLIQLGGGTTFDLRQMTDQHAAQGLQKVLSCLHPFGVTQENHSWKWNAPGQPNAKRDERILVRIVRTLLNDIGFTMDAVEKHENKGHDKAEAAANAHVEPEAGKTADVSKDIKENTLEMLQTFQSQRSNDDSSPSSLPGELGGLCKMILEGETISLAGLPDAKLREALEKLFQMCGLEQCEMEESDSEEDEEEEEKDNNAKNSAIGYGLPESDKSKERVQTSLLSIMEACKQAASSPAAPKKRAVKGPMPMPADFVAPEESSDEEGPAPVGAAVQRAPKKPKELVEQEAEMRARQLRGAVTGQEELMATGPNQREEWMLVPGKFDFLSSIKAGNPQRSRTFQSKSKAEGNESSERVMDPKIKAEMDAIMQAHTEARGPTLVEQHRMKKEQERQEKAASGKGKKGDWNWSREKDLDAGRKVDKDALHQVLGGADSDLKKKFQGGF